MVSSIHQTGYGLVDSAGDYGINTVYKVRICFGFGQNITCSYPRGWCNSIDATPYYYTDIQEENGRVFRNTSTEGAPTLPVTVVSEINGSLVTQNLAPSAFKDPIPLYFKLREGYQLPSWLTFQEGSGRIYGTPPPTASSIPTIEFNSENKNIEIYLVGFGVSSFNRETATLRAYATGTIRSSFSDGGCPQ